MLERTAATLESCTSFHALPSASLSLRSRRKLHTGFWQHGAAAIDISSSAVALPSNSVSLTVSESPIPPPEPLAASTFLLDFLYPSGTVAFLRKLAPGLSDHHQASIRRLPRRSRPFTSSTVGSPLLNHDSQSRYGQATSTSVVKEHQELGHEDIEPAEEEEEEEDVITSLHVTHSGPSYSGAGSQPDLMLELMAKKHTEYFGSVWQLYTQLEPSLQPEFRPKVIKYLHRSSNVIDARRILLLFSEMDASHWHYSIVSSAVVAHLRLGRHTEAHMLYCKALGMDMVCGVEELLQYAFRDADWDRVKEIWVPYLASDACRNPPPLRPSLRSVPRLGKLAIDFARFVSVSKMDDEVARGLGILVRQAARVGLGRGCEPEEALPLLQIIGEDRYYPLYLLKALRRGRLKCLPEIYRVYRGSSNKAIPLEILHGMLDIFYPNDVLGLEQVYEDLHRPGSGGLDQASFRRFVKFYASRGDTKSLERLFETHNHKWGTFDGIELSNNLMNAYANLGDYDGARRIFDELRYRYRMKPTAKTWNLLLKSCMQQATYDRLNSVFEELCKHVKPDDVTFSTMMSMAASKGDEAFTKHLFKKARKRKVKVNIHMLQAMVRAYCYNKRFRAALSICIKARNSDVRGDHADLWNVLLRFHSDRRAFDDVCMVVALMGQYDVQWTSKTHAVLLRALVKVRQAHPAYKVLRAAVEKRSFTLTQEHFATVMEGGLQSHQLRWANKLNKMMQHQIGLAPSIETRLAHAHALIKEGLLCKHSQSKEVDAAGDLMGYIRGLADDVTTAKEMDMVFSDTRQSLKGADSLFHLRQLFTKATNFFTQYDRFDLVKELRGLQANLDQEGGVRPKPEHLSIDTLHSIMQENVHDKMYDAAKEKWELIWQRTLEAAQPALSAGQNSSAVLPAYRYSLSKPFETLQDMFLELRDPKSLKATLDRLLGAGFLLDNHTMNHVCQALARTGFWMDACKLCEQQLMKNWTGWMSERVKNGLKANIPLEQRRIGRAPQWLRPTSYTLIVLAKEYSDLVGMTAWSSAAAEKARVLQEQCPAVVKALQNLPYTGIGIEKEIFGQKDTSTTTPLRDSQKSSDQHEPVLEAE